VSKIHLVALPLIVVVALIALLEQRRVDLGQRVHYPNWPLVAATAGLYALTNLALVASAAWH
jgi:uncharacterized membrane protein